MVEYLDKGQDFGEKHGFNKEVDNIMNEKFSIEILNEVLDHMEKIVGAETLYRDHPRPTDIESFKPWVESGIVLMK